MSTPRQRLSDELDRGWRHLIGLEFRGQCFRCRSTWNVQAHHSIKRRYESCRWGWRNGVLLCAKCHDWAEQNEGAYEDWLCGALPERFAWVIQMRADRKALTRKVTTSEMHEIKVALACALQTFSEPGQPEPS